MVFIFIHLEISQKDLQEQVRKPSMQSSFLHLTFYSERHDRLQPHVWHSVDGLLIYIHIYVSRCPFTGVIFNPFGKAHGAPDDDERQSGDLGK